MLKPHRPQNGGVHGGDADLQIVSSARLDLFDPLTEDFQFKRRGWR